MATTKPTFANLTGGILSAPRYNFSDVEVPAGKFITGDYYAEENTLDGQGTGEFLYAILGFTDVSDGDDPVEADIVYDYTLAEVIPASGIPLAEKGVALGVATLDANAQLDASQLPNLAITDVFVVASEAEMLVLEADTGDVAIRTDVTKSFILSADDASVLANWKELLFPGIAESQSKDLVNDTPTTFASFAIADGASYTGEIIYEILMEEGPAGSPRQSLAGRVRFSATREGTDYPVSISEVGNQTLAAKTGTLTGAISISGAADVVTFSADFVTSQASPDVFKILFRFDSLNSDLVVTSAP